MAAGKAEVEHDRRKHFKFDEWSKLDKELCDAFIQLNGCWNKGYYRVRFGKHSNEEANAAAFFSKNLITTGSTVEYSASCRAFISEKFELELDQLICIGKIDKLGSSNNLTPVKNHPGYFRLKPGSWKYVFPFFKDYQTFVYLCPLSENARSISKEFSDVFSPQNEYAVTDELRAIIAKVTQDGIEKSGNVKISGPASTTRRMINQDTTTTLKRIFTGLEIVKYNAFSLNDPFKTDNVSFTKVSEDLDELFFKVFPQDDKNINIFYLHQLFALLATDDVSLIKLFNLIRKMGYIPHADIKEFGYVYFDHVPCFHLHFWPAIASIWPLREPRYWPSKETVEKIVSNGCHIVPKSPRGKSSNEWRISFSAAELELSHSLTQFQRKCFLVAKLIYYVVVKRIDPDVFGSYFLKTTMFKLLEKQPVVFWENTSPTEVVKILFNDLSCCFEKKNLANFFSEEVNLLEGIENDKLKFATIESAAVAKYPLAFLPENFVEKLQLLRKEVYFTKGFAKVIKAFDDMIPFMHLLTNESLIYNLLNRIDHSTDDTTNTN